MSKMQNPGQTNKVIELISFALRPEGLSLVYFLNDDEVDFKATPQQTVALFKDLELIEHYEISHGEPVIIWEGSDPFVDDFGELYSRRTPAWMYWADYVRFFWESEDNDSKIMYVVALHVEQLKEAEEIRKQFDIKKAS